MVHSPACSQSVLVTLLVPSKSAPDTPTRVMRYALKQEDGLKVCDIVIRAENDPQQEREHVAKPTACIDFAFTHNTIFRSPGCVSLAV